MKKQTKGIILTFIFGGSLLFWATAASLPGIVPEDPDAQITITGTPMDNFPDIQRPQFCESSSVAKFNTYITEFKIPTPCTQPVATVTDPNGNVWFAQTNAGRVAKFDPITESFTEYENPRWPSGGRSMMWGIDYSPDGSIWFTDEFYDKVWKFSIEDEQYESTDFPSSGESLPQRLSVEGSQIIVNDFTGNKLTFLDPAQSTQGTTFLSLPSPVEGSVTGSFGVDAEENIWYTNWIFQTGGVLVKANQEKILELINSDENEEVKMFDFIDIYQFPPGMTTPNGISAGPQGLIWIADTSSNLFFSFDPETEIYTKYATSIPQVASYGNSSGLIKTPVSRPYWNEFDDQGRMIFNEQTANRIGVFDPQKETLVEYAIPSKNPNWADCESLDDCGLAQVFDFTVDGEKIWFTEWVENNIGLLDTSIPLPFDVELDKQKIILKKGEQTQLTLTITPKSNIDIPELSLTSSSTAAFDDLSVKTDEPTFQLDFDAPRIIQIYVSASESALPDLHKLLIGVQTDEVVVSKYVTVIVEQ